MPDDRYTMTGKIAQGSISAGGVPNHAIAEGTLTIKGIAGDTWRYPFHGGRKRAILLLTSEGVNEVAAQGFPICYGALGENLTTCGLDRRSLRIGQRFRAGATIIELTQVRLPCDTRPFMETGYRPRYTTLGRRLATLHRMYGG